MINIPRLSKIQQQFIRFLGGLDTETPPLSRLPGFMREAQNYDSDINGGYGRIIGYERFDGRPAPSAALYYIITATITGVPVVGDTLTGATSGATGKIIALPGGSFVFTKLTGVFVSGENLNVGGPTIAVATSAAMQGVASTSKLSAQYDNLAADVYRADILAVTGSGDIRGVCRLNDVVYAFRDNIGASAGAIYKSTAGGWSAVALGEEVSFTAGNANVGDGDTLTQGGVTATIRRVVAVSGTGSGGTLAGRLVIVSRAGGNFAAGAATSTGAGALTISGVQTAITIAAGGRYEFAYYKFDSTATFTKVYGANGVNRGFEFYNDGTNDIYVPITTGMAIDKPKFVNVFQKQLFFSFDGSLQHAAPNQPYVWSAIVGASELSIGDTITGLVVQQGKETAGAMIVLSRNSVSVLYGTNVIDWVLTQYKQDAGAFPYTAQQIGMTLFLDDRGLLSVDATIAYGNFQSATITKTIQRWINQEKTKAIASLVAHDANQYRIFFNDKYALYITLSERKVIGICPVLFAHKVTCCYSVEKNDGSEIMMFGSDDGVVYQMDAGTSFDGQDIEAFFLLSFTNQGSPRWNKSYKGGMLEIQGAGYTEISIAADLGYGSSLVVQQDPSAVVANFSISRWDSFVWDEFIWDGQTLVPSVFDLRGPAENMSLVVRCVSDYMPRHVLSGAIINYIPRNMIRG